MPARSLVLMGTAALVLTLAAPVVARAAEAGLIASTPSISVTGHAEEWVTPDEAEVVAVVAGSGTTPAAAIADLAPQTAHLVDVVRKAGIADADTASSGPDIEPLYRRFYDAQGHEIMEKREPNGFRARYHLTLRTKDIAGLGRLVPQLTDARATIDGVSFRVSDPDAVRARVEARAVADGVARARAQIDAAGAKAGRLLAIGASDTNSPVPMMRMAVAAPAPALMKDFSFALRPGRQDIRAERQVVMEILP